MRERSPSPAVGNEIEPRPLAAVVAAQAERLPHDPWLFAQQQPGRWRYLSWREAGLGVERTRASLTGLAGRVVAYRWEPRPEAWLLDLAIHAVGGIAAPRPSAESLALQELAATGSGAVLISAGALPLRRRPLVVRPGAGGSVVRDGGVSRLWPEVAAQEEARRLDASLPPPSASRPRRHVLLASGELATRPERTLLVWATTTGAAIVFSPTAAVELATFFWARPTVIGADAATLIELRRSLEWMAGRRRRRGRLRRTLGRLRAVVVSGPLPAAAEVDYWRELEVLLVPLAPSGTAIAPLDARGGRLIQ